MRHYLFFFLSLSVIHQSSLHAMSNTPDTKPCTAGEVIDRDSFFMYYDQATLAEKNISSLDGIEKINTRKNFSGTSLRHLCLNGNQLTHLDLAMLCATFPNLETLDAQNNNITAVTLPESAQLQLDELDLSGNNKLPNGTLGKIKEINLSGNNRPRQEAPEQMKSEKIKKNQHVPSEAENRLMRLLLVAKRTTQPKWTML